MIIEIVACCQNCEHRHFPTNGRYGKCNKTLKKVVRNGWCRYYVQNSEKWWAEFKDLEKINKRNDG